MENSEKIIVVNDEGKKITCDVLCTFDSDETGKSYIVYSDNTVDKDGNTQVYASIYHKGEDSSKLEPIETEKEWKIVDTVIKTIQEELSNKG